jgi:hypothetical protein
MKPFPRILAFSLIIILGYGFACGTGNVIKSFRLAIASSGPLVNSLVAAGAIPQDRASAIIADFDAGAACGLTLQEDFAAIAKDATDARARKLAASQKAFNCFRVVLNRQNFAAHPRLQQVANIADGILASLVVFYSAGSVGDATLPTTATISAKNEADLMRQMELQVQALEKAMRVK